MINALHSGPTPGLQQVDKRDSPQRVLESAQQFEALLIAKFLEEARESATKGPLSGDEDQAGEQAIAFAHQQMANALAHSGGFGLAQMITTQVGRTGYRQEGSDDYTRPDSQKMGSTTKRRVLGVD